MKNYLVKLATVLVFLLVISIPASAEKPDNLPKTGGFPVLINFGAKSIATTTVLLTPGVEFNVGALLPDGTIDFTFDIWDGDVLFGHEDNLATAAAKWTGYLVASGTKGMKWTAGSAGTINLWAIPNGAATCTMIITGAQGQWEE